MSENPIQKMLADIRDKYGDDVWKRACDDVAALGHRPEGWPDGQEAPTRPSVLDPEPVTDPGKPGEVDPVMKAIGAQVRGMQSQAQFNAYMAAFEALNVLLGAIFSGEDPAAARATLDQTLDVAAKVTEVSRMLRDVPEAATSAAAAEFKNPPSVGTGAEYDTQRRLLSDLEALDTSDALAAWYESVKPDIARVSSGMLRNVLFDAIREKRIKLGGTSS